MRISYTTQVRLSGSCRRNAVERPATLALTRCRYWYRCGGVWWRGFAFCVGGLVHNARPFLCQLLNLWIHYCACMVFEGNLNIVATYVVCAGLGCAYLAWFGHCGGFGVTFELEGFFFSFLLR